MTSLNSTPARVGRCDCCSDKASETNERGKFCAKHALTTGQGFYGCHNRAPFRKVVQDYRNPEITWQFRTINWGCGYDLRATDARCSGCEWIERIE